jgi:meso-butanediol dehydrogenase/(S,S)-butanediol dehydrogenase/diacetyl reductase
VSAAIRVTGRARRFDDAVAVVTGGGSGIGRAVCERLAEEGARVWVADIDLAAAERVAASLGAVPLQLDVSDAAAVAAAVDGIVEHAGRIDVVVNNAGITHDGSVWETTPADWARVLAVNLSGVFYGCRAALRHMIAARRGAVVNTASDAGLVGWPGQAAYCASKGGVVQLTRAAAMDAAPYGVRVNCVCPAFTDTPLTEAWIGLQPDAVEARANIAMEQPLGRIGTPEEIAAAIAYLASDEAAFVTGVALAVDGGVTAR